MNRIDVMGCIFLTIALFAVSPIIGHLFVKWIEMWQHVIRLWGQL